jgi:hypothetical protein
VHWQDVGDFVVRIAPYLVVLVAAIGSWIRGRDALKAKDDLIRTLEQLRPAKLLDDIKALHDYYRDVITRVEKEAEARERELVKGSDPAERERLQGEIALLKEELKGARALSDAAQIIAEYLPKEFGAEVATVTISNIPWPPRRRGTDARPSQLA